MISAFVLIKAGTGEHLNFAKTAKQQIEKIQGVEKVYGVFGRYDLIAYVEAKDLEQLSKIIMDNIGSISGVLATESLIIGY